MYGYIYYALSLTECASDQSAIFIGSAARLHARANSSVFHSEKYCIKSKTEIEGIIYGTYTDIN